MTNQNAPDDVYFQRISQALAHAGAYRPTLVVDKQRLDHNIEQLMSVIQRDFHYRIVAKSLPSLPLLNHIMHATGSHRIMSFHLPFLMVLVEHTPHADILLGKPMPVQSARQFYHWHAQNKKSLFKPEFQLQWLIDSVDRLQQYLLLAEASDTTLQINLEIDVGLHRGGFNDRTSFIKALNVITQSDRLKLSGLMGYEAHITKIPALLGGHKKAFAKAMESYREYTDLVQEVMGEDALQDLTLNSGGSSTYPLFSKPSCVNDISTASALVKPTDFDLFTLELNLPAVFISTPVLKTVTNPDIPMAKGLSKLMRLLGLLSPKACFIYGGNWLAEPCYPADARRSKVLGHSSNQEMYELDKNCSISVDDFMFFRPTQSEAVFLQFDDIAVYDNGSIIDWWPVFQATKTEST